MSDSASETAKQAPPKKRRLGRLRRIWKWTWRCSLVLLLAAYFSRNAVLGPWLLDKVEPIVQEALGTPVELDGIAGSWLGGIELELARSLGDGDLTPVRNFELTGIKLRYSIWQLLRGQADWLHSIEAQSATLVLDAAQVQPAAEEEEVPAGAIKLPARLPQLNIEQLAVLYEDGEISAEIRRASIRTPVSSPLAEQDAAADTPPPPSSLAILLPDVRFTRDGERAPIASLATELQYADGVLEIPSLLVDGIERLERARLDLSKIAAGELQYDFSASVLSGAVAAKGSLRDQRVRADVQASGLLAEQLQPWLDLGLRGQLDFQGEVDWPLEAPLEGVADFQFGAAQNGWRRVEIEAISGRLRVAEGWLISERLEAQGPALDLFAEDCRLPLFAEGRDTASTQGSFVLSVGDLPAWLDRLELELPPEASALESLELRAQIDSSPQRVAVTMQELELRTSLGSWMASGSVALPALQLAPDSPIELQLEGSEVDLAQLRAFLSAQGRFDTAQLPLAGKAGLQLSVQGTAAAPQFQLGLLLQNIDPGTPHPELPPGPYQGQLQLNYQDGVLALEPAILTGPHLEWSAHAEYALALDLSAIAKGVLPQLEGAVTLRTDLRADPHRHLRGVVQAQLELDTTLDAQGLPQSSKLAWEVQSDGIQLAAAELQTAALRFAGSGSWSAIDPIPQIVQANYQLHGLQYQDAAAFSAQGELALEGTQAEVDMQLSEADGATLGQLALALPVDLHDLQAQPDGPLALRFDLDRPLELTRLEELLASFGVALIPPEQGLQVAGAIDFDLVGEGTWAEPRLHAGLNASQVTFTPEDELSPAPLPGPLDLTLQLTHENGITELGELLATAGPMNLNASGSWSVEEALLPLLRQGKAIPEGRLQLDGQASIPDVSFLASMPGIRRIEGQLEAELAVTGTDRAPVLQADWALHQGALRLDDPSIAAFDRLEFVGDFNGQVARLIDCRGELGSAPFSAEGMVDLREEFPLIDVRLDGTDLLLFRRQGVKVRSDTGLHIHGPLNALRVDGELTLTDGRYTKPVDFIMPLLRRGQPPSSGVEGISLFSLAAPLDTMNFDLRVRPGNGFRIKTNVANGMVRPDLRLVGTGEVPYLLGEVYLDQTILSMPAHRITVEQGVIRFSEENPFVPTLDIRAGFRRYGYDVTILVEGDITEPVITMSSVPPLESEELLLFTTTGQPPQEAANAQEALGTVAVYLAQDWLRRFFGDLSTEEEESLFDRIEIEFGRDATNQGAETIEGRFLLRRDNILENDALYLTGERDAYSDFNLGLRIRFLFP